MPRSRSRSPRRERRRSRSRERERRRHRRSRSRSPRHRSRSPRHSDERSKRSRSPRYGERDRKSKREDRERSRGFEEKNYEVQEDIDGTDLIVVDDDETEMMKAMGFNSFDSSKGKKVDGNDIYVTNTVSKRRYRQYMNRRGGFNRPLDFIA